MIRVTTSFDQLFEIARGKVCIIVAQAHHVLSKLDHVASRVNEISERNYRGLFACD